MSSPCPSATKCLLFQGFHPSHDQLPLDAKQHHWADMQADMLRVQQVLTDAHSLHHTAYHGSRRLQKVSTSCGDPGQQGIIASVLAVVERVSHGVLCCAGTAPVQLTGCCHVACTHKLSDQPALASMMAVVCPLLTACQHMASGA